MGGSQSQYEQEKQPGEMMNRTASFPTMVVVAALTVPMIGGQVQAQSSQVELITAAEAALPPAPSADLTQRAGISRGPTITLVSPAPSQAVVKSPVHLQLNFQGRGGETIDVGSLKLSYLKAKSVDLTERVKAFVKPNGIDIPEAQLPPGKHALRAEIKDKGGRSGVLVFDLSVPPR
jgi:hypothetical protein